MELVEGGIYHIYNRGNNKQKIFFSEQNYLFFLKKIKVELLPYCEILAYCLMPNHFHLIVYIKLKNQVDNLKKTKTLNNGIAILLRSYTRAIQRQENYTGSLFQQKTKAKEIKDGSNNSINLVSICAHYVHQNPKKAGLVNNLESWKYSSYLDYMGLRNGTLCNKELFYLLADIKKEEFIAESNRLLEERFVKDLF